MIRSGISKYRPDKKEARISFSAMLAFCKKSAKWGLLFLYSAWVFVLGILVGRETSPIKFDTEKLQKELAALRESVITREQKHFEIDRDSLYDKMPELDFHQALKSTEDDIGFLTPPESSDAPDGSDEPSGKVSEPAPVSPLSDQTTSDMNEDYTVTKAAIPEKTAVRRKKEKPREISVQRVSLKKTESRPDPPQSVQMEEVTPPPAPEEAPQSGKNITVQVASFKLSKDAENLVSQLQKKGYPAYVSPAVVFGKGIYYRVRVGYFETRAKASSTKKQLKKDRFDSFYTNCDN